MKRYIQLLFFATSFLSTFLLISSCGSEPARTVMVVVRGSDDILPLDSPAVTPVYYHNEFDFRQLETNVKKDKFIEMVLPSVLMAKHNLRMDRIRARSILLSQKEGEEINAEDSTFMEVQKERLNADSWKDVYDRLATHPASIVLAQAAVESGWGSSRFFRQGNNLFGVWSFDKDEKRIPASGSRDSGAVFLRAYDNLGQSVEDYFITLARHNAYREFRQRRLDEKDPRKLIFALHRYSELGYQYVNKLAMVMRQNDLQQYDRYHLDSAYINLRERSYF